MDAVTQPLGNAAMADLVPDGMDEEMGMLGSVGDSLASASGAADEAQAAADAPLSTGARWLGLDGLVASGDSLSYSGNAGLAKQVDLTLGMLGPLTLGIYGNFASDLAYSLTGTVASGWFGGRYATLAGQARLNLDTAIGAKLALSLGLAEAGLRGLELDTNSVQVESTEFGILLGKIASAVLDFSCFRGVRVYTQATEDRLSVSCLDLIRQL